MRVELAASRRGCESRLGRRAFLRYVLGKTCQSTARGFANRLGKETTEDAARVQRAYQLAFGREPSAEELQLGLAFAGGDVTAEGDKVSRWEQYCQALLATNEFLYVD